MIKLKFSGRYLALAFVFAWFLIGGIMHFARPDLFTKIVPPYIPFPLTAVYISGALELLGAIGLGLKPTRSLAGYGLIMLTIAVTPANIYMLQQANVFSEVPYWALVARLPFQLLLIWLIWWCSREKTAKKVSK